jgi:hypothetical protein
METGFVELTPELLKTPEGINELNRMLKALHNFTAGDGASVRTIYGVGHPEGVVAAGVGSIYMRSDGGVGSAIYIKETGTGATGWHAVTGRRIIMWFRPSDAAVATNVSARIDLPFACTIKKARAYAKTAPTGANLIFDINKNGTSIWAATQANRLTITATNNTGSQTSFDTVALAVDDYLTLDIDQIGSTLAGSDITVELEVG